MISINGKYPKYISPIDRGLPPKLTLNEEQRKKILESLQTQRDKVAQSQATTVRTTIDAIKKYHPEIFREIERQKQFTSFDLSKELDPFWKQSQSTAMRSQALNPNLLKIRDIPIRPYAGKDGAGVAPWAKEGISYEQWRAKHPTTVQSQGGHNFTIPIMRGGPAFKISLGNDYPLLGKDPITWSPTKKSSQTGTRTGKTTTRKPMGIGAVLGILKTVIPTAWTIARTGGDILVNTFFQGQYGDGYTFDREGQDEMPSASEIKGEEILVATRADLTKRQIFAAVADQAHIESSAFHMPTLGLKHSQVTISLHLEYTFSPQPTEVNTTVGLPNINFNDHIAMNLMPKNFAFYKNLLKHELIKFNNCTIVSSNTSGFDTTTNVGFFPATKLTTHVSNAVLLQMSKRLELDPEEKMAYTIRYVSPAIIKYAINEQQQYTKVQSLDMFLEPNKIIRTEYLQGLAADEALSYGTVVIVKQNVGSVIGMSYTVNMTFDVWDYIINGCKLEDVEDKNLDGDTTDPGESGNPDGGDDGQGGDGSGSSRPPTGSSRVGRRQVKK